MIPVFILYSILINEHRAVWNIFHPRIRRRNIGLYKQTILGQQNLSSVLNEVDGPLLGICTFAVLFLVSRPLFSSLLFEIPCANFKFQFESRMFSKSACSTHTRQGLWSFAEVSIFFFFFLSVNHWSYRLKARTWPNNKDCKRLPFIHYMARTKKS